MKSLLALIFLASTFVCQAQSFQLEGNVPAIEPNGEMGQITVYSLPDSALVKGSYLDSAYFSVLVPSHSATDFYARIKVYGYADSLISFKRKDTVVKLGVIQLEKDLNLETVDVIYRKPLYERTIDGIEVNVEGTTLETMDNLFEILKASPRLMSRDDESIEMIGKGVPLIMVDRQSIVSVEELKAIPANMVEKINIITNPSAKYRAQGKGNGVIEVFTKDFHLQGYNLSVNTSGGVNTQKKPTANLGIGLSLKQKKFSLNGYLNGDFTSRFGSGNGENIFTDGSNRYSNWDFRNNSWNLWQSYSTKAAYQINDKQKISAGIRGGGSRGGESSFIRALYEQSDVLQTTELKTTDSDYNWQNNSAFLIYSVETDTNESVLEVVANYQFKTDEERTIYHSDYENHVMTDTADFDLKRQTRNRPNIAELRLSYQHVFDTTGWKLSGGGSYSYVFNNMKYDASNLDEGNNWVIDPIYSNDYDYVEQIGSVFVEVSKEWKKVSTRLGVTGEYTSLSGYSSTMSKQFLDSVYVLPFPSASVMFLPNEKITATVSYTAGIDRPEFFNYDPFVRINDSLNVRYGNPYLRPAVSQNFGLDLNLFQGYGIGVDYVYNVQPRAELNFIDDNYITNSTPRNGKDLQKLVFSLIAPIKGKWIDGWNSFSLVYSKYEFTPEFNRDDFYNVTYHLWSNLNFHIKGNVMITNSVYLFKWGNDNSAANLVAYWSVKCTKRLLDNKLRIYAEVANIVPPKYKVQSVSGNYKASSRNQQEFTAFKLGVYYKFGRLKRDTQINESSSGQSGRV